MTSPTGASTDTSIWQHRQHEQHPRVAAQHLNSRTTRITSFMHILHVKIKVEYQYSSLSIASPLYGNSHHKKCAPTNSRWRTAAILKNRKSPYLCNRWYVSPCTRLGIKKIPDLENPRWQMVFESSTFLWCTFLEGKRLLHRPVVYLINS